MCYQISFCFWLLTFEQDIAEEINKSVPISSSPYPTQTHNYRKYDIIPLLTDVAQAAVKEKVIRVIVSTFRGLVTRAPAANLPAMLVSQLLPFVKNLSTRKWSDEDIVEDVQFLRDELSARFESLTWVVLIRGGGFDNTHHPQIVHTTSIARNSNRGISPGRLFMSQICSGKRMRQN